MIGVNSGVCFVIVVGVGILGVIVVWWFIDVGVVVMFVEVGGYDMNLVIYDLLWVGELWYLIEDWDFFIVL